MWLSRDRNDAKHEMGAAAEEENVGRGWLRRRWSPARWLLEAGRSRLILVAGVAIAVVAAPVALASSGGGTAHKAAANNNDRSSLRGGIHNPPHASFARTTGLFANTRGWVSRTKNLGSGGAATLVCHAPAGGAACLEAANTKAGFAFAFKSSGSTGGTILLKNAEGAPFTTNAHGVATGLNANYLEGKQASEFQLAAKPAADSEKLGGQTPDHYVNTGELLFANVEAGPKITSTRGATAVTAAGSTYTVVFGTTDVSKCSYTASPEGAALASGAIGVAPVENNAPAVAVSVPAGFTGGFDLQVVC